MCVESPCHQKTCKNVTTLAAHRGRFRKAVSHRQPRGGHGLAFGEPSPERTARVQKIYHPALTQLVGALKNHKRWGSNLRSSSLLAGFAPTAFPVYETHSKFSKPTGGRQRCFICITTQPILNALREASSMLAPGIIVYSPSESGRRESLTLRITFRMEAKKRDSKASESAFEKGDSHGRGRVIHEASPRHSPGPTPCLPAAPTPPI